MTHPHRTSDPGVRARFLLAAAAWTVLVAAVLVAVPLAFAGRLPDPVASHWGPSGQPDRSMPSAALTLFALVWAVIAGTGLAGLARARGEIRRETRAWYAAGLGWIGGFLIGIQAVTVAANLGRDDWTQAASLNWEIAVVVGVAFALGALGRLAGRLGPDDAPPERERPGPLIDLDPRKRPVWVSTATAPWAVALGVVAFAVALSFAAAALWGLAPAGWATALPLALVGVIGLAVSSVSVRIASEGLTMAFGPLRWPSRTVRLERVERAWVDWRSPVQVGGWGIRGLPGRATVMIRGGECLVVRYTSGGQLAISVDDAETGAALLNTLAARKAA
ncbi:DUF1648 domain-containing protein [Microbispora cellulosiformans]|uniref:DUF1648 domain-containing protein n=1 Tax=Microbispora cellulosiformans TaxID=2614688 RepID=A0A5J5K5J8_9ACTN|nr:DUF1648 domain-containing protein [Microbispora cellulosiformans]KAA9379762.1 DUF1648 domain-containing protein [Microbispora cellulosiformans]